MDRMNELVHLHCRELHSFFVTMTTHSKRQFIYSSSVHILKKKRKEEEEAQERELVKTLWGTTPATSH